MKGELAKAWDLGPDFSLAFINESENQTYRVDTASGPSYALRINRPGYHTGRELNSELAWLLALSKGGKISVPLPVAGRDGQYVQKIAGQTGVLFQWLPGKEPLITDNLLHLAESLGALAAQLHEHVSTWQKPDFFQRPKWGFEECLGDIAPRWGHWKNGLGLTRDAHPLVQKTIDRLRHDLAAYGESQNRFNLIHADLRLANLLHDGANLHVIDFDDCGYGWLMYDAATMVSFHEHEPVVPELIAQWLKGYRSVRSLSSQDEAIIPALILFRRILLMAWLGSHSTIALAQQLKPTFATQTLELCSSYLKRAS